MIKLTFCLRRRSGLSREEFQRYWRERHAPLVERHAASMGCKRYVQVHTSAPEYNEQIRVERGGPEPYDGVAELWFDENEFQSSSFDLVAVRKAVEILIADEREFIDLSQSPLFYGVEHPIIG